MVCGSEARCQKGKEVGRRRIETYGTKRKDNREQRKEEGDGNLGRRI